MTWTTLIYTWKRNVVSKGDSEEKWSKWWCKRSKKLSMSTVYFPCKGDLLTEDFMSKNKRFARDILASSLLMPEGKSINHYLVFLRTSLPASTELRHVIAVTTALTKPVRASPPRRFQTCATDCPLRWGKESDPRGEKSFVTHGEYNKLIRQKEIFGCSGYGHLE